MKVLAGSTSVVLLCHGAMVHATGAGIAGHSGKDPAQDCTACHVGGRRQRDFTLAGPSAVSAESTAAYTLTLYGTSGSVGGINVATSSGALQAATDDTQLSGVELVHARTQSADASGALRFKFYWNAPDTPDSYTLFVAAVVGNGDGTPQGDNTVLTEVNVDVVDPSASFNEPPLAHIHVPSAALVGDAVFMNATRSTDTDGNIVSYEWDFGDGSVQKLEQPTVEHKYKSPGFYAPQLTVTDDKGLTGSAIVQIEVMVVEAALGHARPKADAGGPYVALAAQEVRFDASQSRGSGKEGQILHYEWDFGDGSMGSGEAPTHVYDRPGRYIATVTVWDDRGLPNSAVAKVRVEAGESAKLGMFRVPSRVAIWEGEGVRHRFQFTLRVEGLRDGVTRCGVVYLQRNGEDYRHQTFCVTGKEQLRATFEHLFANSDAPSVEWTAYAVLENGAESQHLTRISQVVVFPAQRR